MLLVRWRCEYRDPPSTHTQLVVEKGQFKHQCGHACCAYTYVNACKLNTTHTCSNSNADYLYLCANVSPAFMLSCVSQMEGVKAYNRMKLHSLLPLDSPSRPLQQHQLISVRPCWPFQVISLPSNWHVSSSFFSVTCPAEIHIKMQPKFS